MINSGHNSKHNKGKVLLNQQRQKYQQPIKKKRNEIQEKEEIFQQMS